LGQKLPMFPGQMIADEPLSDIFYLLTHAEPRLDYLFTGMEW
jgi:hypothetical protein